MVLGAVLAGAAAGVELSLEVVDDDVVLELELLDEPRESFL